MASAKRSTRIALTLCLSIARILTCQQSNLVAGDRIRLHQASSGAGATITGILLAATLDSIYYRPAAIAEGLVLPRASILAVDRRVAGGDQKLAGAALGLISGAVVGGVLGYRGSHAYIDHQSMKGLSAFVGAIGGGLGGVLVGLEVGSRVSWEQWEPVVLPDRVSLIPRAHYEVPGARLLFSR